MNNPPKIRSRTTMAAAMTEVKYYHEWVFNSFAKFIIGGRTLEVGSGHGIYSKKIAGLTEQLIVSDIDALAIERIAAELVSLKNIEYLVMDGIDVDRLSSKVHNVILINLLEHIKDDALFLRICHNILYPEGQLIIFTPAFPCLFSNYDKEAGHYRRYTKRTLRELLREQFTIKKIRYFNAIGFFGWLFNKYAQSHIQSPRTDMQIKLYDRVIPLLKYVDYLLPFWGQSLLVIATKKE